jgi:hypothetical protein
MTLLSYLCIYAACGVLTIIAVMCVEIFYNKTMDSRTSLGELLGLVVVVFFLWPGVALAYTVDALHDIKIGQLMFWRKNKEPRKRGGQVA